jgi:hypothetical protein
MILRQEYQKSKLNLSLSIEDQGGPGVGMRVCHFKGMALLDANQCNWFATNGESNADAISR